MHEVTQYTPYFLSTASPVDAIQNGKWEIVIGYYLCDLEKSLCYLNHILDYVAHCCIVVPIFPDRPEIPILNSVWNSFQA